MSEMGGERTLLSAVVAVLVLVVILLAFAVVSTAFQSRQLHVALNTLMREKTLLDEQYGRLLLEKNARISSAEIELVASQTLKMRAPNVAKTVVIVQ